PGGGRCSRRRARCTGARSSTYWVPPSPPSRGPPDLALWLSRGGEAGQPRLQWTTAQDDPRTGRHAKPYRNRGNCTTEDEPELLPGRLPPAGSWTGWTVTTLLWASANFRVMEQVLLIRSDGLGRQSNRVTLRLLRAAFLRDVAQRISNP